MDVSLASDSGGCIAIMLSKTESMRSDVSDPISGGSAALAYFGWISSTKKKMEDKNEIRVLYD
jgi:hypothetical protein